MSAVVMSKTARPYWSWHGSPSSSIQFASMENLMVCNLVVFTFIFVFVFYDVIILSVTDSDTLVSGVLPWG